MCIGPFAPKIPKVPQPPAPQKVVSQLERDAAARKVKLRQVRAKASGTRSTLGPKGFLGIPTDQNN